ncbi:MAG: hypothetical protein J3K34DRAFT_455232 [Monoraphidium minutum]|nr:MAG: hypothetical protein J3K34DRAFT_455232 [Monoraphidium minutum]
MCSHMRCLAVHTADAVAPAAGDADLHGCSGAASAPAAGAAPPPADEAARGLLDLPPALLHTVVDLCWAQGGAPALLALSRASRGLLRAADAALGAAARVAPAATARLRAAPPPGVERAGAVMGRLLRSLGAVASIDLSGLHFWVYDSSLEVIGRSCRQLESLRLDYCQHITGDGLHAMTSGGGLRRLRELSIGSCGDVGAGAFLSGLPALRVLRAAYSHSLQGEQLLAVAAGLEYLDVSGCDGVGDELCTSLPAARALNLSFAPVTDGGLEALAAGSRGLATLWLARRSNNLWAVGLYSDAGVAALARKLPGLEIKYCM